MIINYNPSIAANFKITFPKKQELEFFALSTNVPTTALSPIELSYQDTRAKVPDNKYVWDDITVQFILDENLYAYEILKDWQKAVRERQNWQDGLLDMFIVPLDSNKVIEYKFSFQGAWPNMVSGWQYTSGTSISDVITFDVAFSYQHFEIEREKPLNFKIV